MRKKGVVVSAAVLAVITVMSGVIAAVFLAMSLRYPRPSNHGVYCKYTPSLAMPFAVVAAGLALTTQVLASTAIGCCGAWRNVTSQTRRVVAIILFVCSWVLTIKVVILFMVAAMLGFGGYVRNVIENGSCIALGVGILMAPIVLILIVVSLNIASYNLIQKGDLDSRKVVRSEKQPCGISMGASGATKC